MSKLIEGKVVGKHRWSEQLYSLQVDAAVAPFEAGQFTKLGLHVDGIMVERPYSFVNAPNEKPHEFYFTVVPEGPLTHHLINLEANDAIWLLPRAAGFLTLSEVPDAENLWLLATGTGIGPFLSILKSETPWQRFQKVVLVHAVRYASELSYGEAIQRIAQNHPNQFRFVPFVSREDNEFSLRARVPETISDGRLETKSGVVLSAEKSQVMLCGNPDMVRDTTEALLARGLKKNRRRDSGQITLESYW